MPNPSQPLPDRRKAFKKIGKWLLAGGGMLTVAWVALGREGPIDEWVTVGDIQSLTPGEMTPRRVSVAARGRWFLQHVDRLIWLLRHPDGSLIVLSGVCPHKNYNINWRRDLGTFVCPGHKSAFDASGRVLGGPSPRPLDALEYKLENGALMVRYQKFRQNIPSKELFA